jgi:sporulation protein YlmC with PRC-barrel domain
MIKPHNEEQDVITSDDILGKNAVDSDGAILGTIVKIHISKKSKLITGITIDMGFMKPDLYVGIDYIKHFGIDAIFLNSIPADKFKGIKVLTSDGVEIGFIKKVLVYKKKIKEVVIKTKDGVFSYAETTIPSKFIKKIGNSVILKRRFTVDKLETRAETVKPESESQKEASQEKAPPQEEQKL